MTKAYSTAKVDKDLINFITKATQSNLMEIEAGKLAETRASRKDIRDFATMLVKDHTTANEELSSLSGTKAIECPTILEKGKREDVDDLASKNGVEFDKAFVNEMVDGHKDAVNLFEDTIKDTKDADVRTFAMKILPKLKQHHRMALDLQEKLKELTMR